MRWKSSRKLSKSKLTATVHAVHAALPYCRLQARVSKETFDAQLSGMHAYIHEHMSHPSSSSHTHDIHNVVDVLTIDAAYVTCTIDSIGKDLKVLPKSLLMSEGK